MNALRVETFQGSAINPYVDHLADLRIRVFRDYPYLYDGSMAYEKRYLSTYSRSPESLFVLVFDQQCVVGASTGMPLMDEVDEFKAPFLQANMNPERVFYFGESVLLRAYRGRGLGVRFFQERERYAVSLKRFTHTAFCAVKRPVEHPMKPVDYTPLDRFWTHRGYQKRADLTAHFPWTDIGDERETHKPMVFWMKRIADLDG